MIIDNKLNFDRYSALGFLTGWTIVFVFTILAGFYDTPSPIIFTIKILFYWIIGIAITIVDGFIIGELKNGQAR